MKKLLLTLCLFSMTAHAEWKYLDSTDTFDSYIDYSMIKTEGRYKSLWELRDLKSPQTLQGKRYKSTENKLFIDCQNSRYQMVATFLYPEQMGNGGVVLSESLQLLESEWKYTPPNSIANRFINIACGRK